MHYFTISSWSLMFAACLAPHIHAQRDQPPGMDAIFEVASKKHSACPASVSARFNVQFPNMQRVIALGAGQMPNADTITSPRTYPLSGLLYNAPLGGPPYTRSARAFISKTYQKGDKLLTKPPVPTELRTLILCGSLDVLWKKSWDLVPWHTGRHPLTIGELYEEEHPDEYWYFYVSEAKAIGRVPKTSLPPIEDAGEIGGTPFPRYRPPVGYGIGVSFCADPQSRFWSFLVDRFANDKTKSGGSLKGRKRGIIVLCDRSLEERKVTNSEELLPDEIDLSHQEIGTPLDFMKPAWFDWSCAVLALGRIYPSTGDVRYLRPATIKRVNEEHPDYDPRQPLSKSMFTSEKEEIATSAHECIMLSEWQMAEPKSKVLRPTGQSGEPAAFNPASNMWLPIAAYLQIVPDPPQSWATAVAGEYLPPLDSGGSDDDDSDDDSDGDGSRTDRDAPGQSDDGGNDSGTDRDAPGESDDGGDDSGTDRDAPGETDDEGNDDAGVQCDDGPGDRDDGSSSSDGSGGRGGKRPRIGDIHGGRIEL